MSEQPETSAPRGGLAVENVAVLVLAALLVGLLIGHALGRRQGLTINQVGMPPDAMHAGLGEPSATGDDAALADSAPPSPETLEDARAMVAQMGNAPAAELVELGNRKFDNGHWLLAIAFYEAALGRSSDQPEVWCDLGAAFHAANQNEDALRCFDEALKREPEQLQAWFNRGVVYAAMGRRDDSTAAYRKVIALKPDDPLSADARTALAALGAR